MTSQTNKPRTARTTPGCGKPGHDEDYFSPNGKRRCKQCLRETGRRGAKKRRLRRRRQALEAYGNKCACCGITEEVFLVIGHVNNYESVRKKATGPNGGSTLVYEWLEKQNYPEGFQVLCHNCNHAKSQGGCPHQEDQK